jgi:hypothetical protein
MAERSLLGIPKQLLICLGMTAMTKPISPAHFTTHKIPKAKNKNQFHRIVGLLENF